MNKLNKINLEIQKITRELEAALALKHAEKIAVIKKRVIGCPSCHTAGQVKNWGFVQNYWYTSPHGDSEGDHWNKSETKVCFLICPHCNELIYIYNHYQRDKIVELIDAQNVNVNEIFGTVWKKQKENIKQIFPGI